MSRRRLVGFIVVILVLLAGASPPAAASHRPDAEILVSGLEGGSGSTVGPDGAIYVTEGFAGRVSRVDPRTGDVTPYVTGLPPSIIGIGGAIDVAFIRDTAYVLVTLVGPDVGGTGVVGVYRVDGPDSFTVIADIGAFSMANPPDTSFFVPTGVQYAIQAQGRHLLVTDGHHNRVLSVELDGTITEIATFGNIVPTGMALRGNRLFMAEAGPVPHLPEDGEIVSFLTKPGADVREIASGAPLLVDVEFGRCNQLYALSQGIFPVGNPEGSPAAPDTGAIVRVTSGGALEVLVEGLDRPTSMEIIRDNAYVVTLDGEIIEVDGLSAGHRPGRCHSGAVE